MAEDCHDASSFFADLSYKLYSVLLHDGASPGTLNIWMEFSVVFFSGQMELNFLSTKETK